LSVIVFPFIADIYKYSCYVGSRPDGPITILSPTFQPLVQAT